MNDAFGCVHRSHASVDAITKYMPSYVGNLLDEELTNLHNITDQPESPSITILGGSKISTKISVLKNLSIKMDSIVICGGMANNFLAYNGHDIKNSLIVQEELCKTFSPYELIFKTHHFYGSLDGNKFTSSQYTNFFIYVFCFSFMLLV